MTPAIYLTRLSMSDKLLRLFNGIRSDAGAAELDSIDDDAKLRDDLGFDSLELAVLAVKIEAEFGVDVFEQGIVLTVGELRGRINE
ncbi:acyl carrier protein [Planctomycetes bacterium K23_9]|uniref:Acyl carrier protein n=2 Tax=Stieleria marina TaxID=1930275 RepID=A0A517NYS0_9BACT|nr:acyl carrier protein [Planctomycetes bacterium K23_9]